MVLCKFLLLCALLLLGHAQAKYKALTQTEYWSYDRCSPHGPHSTYWTRPHCSGVQNSPIDLCGARPFPEAAPAIAYDALWAVAREMDISHTGHTLRLTPRAPAPRTDVGNLHYLVGRGTNSSAQTWVLEQLNVHFGRAGPPLETAASACPSGGPPTGKSALTPSWRLQQLPKGGGVEWASPTHWACIARLLHVPLQPHVPMLQCAGSGCPTCRTPPPRRWMHEKGRGKGPQGSSRRRLDRRLEEVAKAVGGGYCLLQMPLKPAPDDFPGLCIFSKFCERQNRRARNSVSDSQKCRAFWGA